MLTLQAGMVAERGYGGVSETPSNFYTPKTNLLQNIYTMLTICLQKCYSLLTGGKKMDSKLVRVDTDLIEELEKRKAGKGSLSDVIRGLLLQNVNKTSRMSDREMLDAIEERVRKVVEESTPQTIQTIPSYAITPHVNNLSQTPKDERLNVARQAMAHVESTFTATAVPELPQWHNGMKAGTRCRKWNGVRWVEVVAPELDGDGNPIP